MLKFLFFGFIAFLITCLVSGFSRVASGGKKVKSVQVGSVFQALLGLALLAFALYIGVKVLFFAISY